MNTGTFLMMALFVVIVVAILAVTVLMLA